jgi:hypothetical protein
MAIPGVPSVFSDGSIPGLREAAIVREASVGSLKWGQHIASKLDVLLQTGDVSRVDDGLIYVRGIAHEVSDAIKHPNGAYYNLNGESWLPTNALAQAKAGMQQLQPLSDSIYGIQDAVQAHDPAAVARHLEAAQRQAHEVEETLRASLASIGVAVPSAPITG